MYDKSKCNPYYLTNATKIKATNLHRYYLKKYQYAEYYINNKSKIRAYQKAYQNKNKLNIQVVAKLKRYFKMMENTQD